MSCHLCETCCPSCCECHRDGYERGCETVYAERDAALSDRDSLKARLVEVEKDRDAAIRERDGANGVIGRIVIAMGCAPDDNDDLIEAVRLLIAERDAAIREADRLRHGVPIEGDFVCPDGLALTELKARLESAEGVYGIARRWCNRPESVINEERNLHNDVEMWRKLRAAVDIATAARKEK